MATWNLEKTKAHIMICNGASCLRKQGEEVTVAIRKVLKERSLNDVIHTTRTRCNGRCQGACTIIVYPEGTWYQKILPEDAEMLVDAINKGEQFDEKVTHMFQGSGFVRVNGAPTGILKSEKTKKPPAR